MSCPFFMPAAPVSIAALPHPERLPLGNSYSGHCTAANFTPTDAMLHDCNLGYAACMHLPADRGSDAVRFSMRRDPHGFISISYVVEAAHAPVAQGILTYDASAGRWRERHPDARLQRMAECCVQSLRKES